MVTSSPSSPDSPPAPIPSDASAPNWYDGPMEVWAIVDRSGHAFGFGSQRFASELLDRWETKLKQFAPYRLVRFVEQREP